jgi:FkbM family methyltransferase
MFYIRERSLDSLDPVFQRLRKDCMVFPDDQVIAKDFAQQGNYEQSLIEWAASLIDPTTLFLDIGAHVGTYSLFIAKRCAGVHSFECGPKTFNYLCANIAIQDMDSHITPHRIALGSKPGHTPYYLHAPKDGGGNSCIAFARRDSPFIQVPVATLDSFHLDNIGLIKIDVEGFEKDVLEGAVETLKRSGYPRILFESWRPQRESEGIPALRLRTELFQYVRSIGYRIVPVNGWDEMFIAEYTGTAPTTS